MAKNQGEVFPVPEKRFLQLSNGMKGMNRSSTHVVDERNVKLLVSC